MLIFLAFKKESFEPAKNLRKTSDGLRMLSALCTLLNQYGKDNFKPIMKGL
jgi:thymidine kinase